MKHLLFLIFAVQACLPGFAACDGRVRIVPRPAEVEELPGSFRLTPRTPVVITDEQLRTPAEIFARAVGKLTGTEPAVTAAPEKHAVTLQLQPGYEAEEYLLEVGRQRITVTASTPQAVLHGLRSLQQLVAGGEIPACVVRDKPTFAYRGAMLDVCRHFFPVEDVKTYIDILSLHKINKFHWHLTDDQGWRVEIDSHPELITVGSRRRSSDFGQYHFAEEYSGYFTKDEIREVVAYADDNYIEVIPEFDMPGHTLSVLAAYPELSCKGKPLEVGTKQGIFDDILCAGNDDSLKLVFDVLGEMIELFPGRYFHIGGDEAPKVRWKNCPKCQARMKELGLKDEEELQGWFVLQAVDFLKKHGKTAIVWNESLNSGMMPNDIIVQRWMDKKDRSVEFANKGGKMIVSEFYYYYCDYPYGMTSLKKTYSLDPYIKGLTEAGKKNVYGVECPIWVEYIRDFDKLSYMCFPRFWAVAEAGWTKRANMDYNSFEERFEALRPMLEEMGIKPAPRSDWNPNFLQSLKELRQFFKGTTNLGNILNMIRNNQA